MIFFPGFSNNVAHQYNTVWQLTQKSLYIFLRFESNIIVKTYKNKKPELQDRHSHEIQPSQQVWAKSL